MAKANKLWTKTAFAKVPALYAQENKGDNAMVHVRIFSMLNGWEWLVTEFNPETGEAFGLVKGDEAELGYFAIGLGDDQYDGESMQDNNDNWRGRFVMPPFERDLHFTPKTLGQLR